ncbi:MAG TPA: diguanylate cyclase [Rhodoferax sp.]
MSATYAPDVTPNDDTKGRLFNFYGVVPEKGFPIFQAQDIVKVFTYSGPDALKLETFEFCQRGFGSASHDTFFTLMYWDPSNKAWMTTIPGTPWVLTLEYPRALMVPSIIENLVILAVLGVLTLLVESFVLRSILQNQVAHPLSRLIQAGDDCLRSVAHSLHSTAIRAGDLAARYGGEEFAVICPSVDKFHVLDFGHKLCRAVEALALPHVASPLGHVSISIGVAVIQAEPGKSSADLLKMADEALYRAKAQGRNQAVLADV